jgi:hypothetical protein
MIDTNQDRSEFDLKKCTVNFVRSRISLKCTSEQAELQGDIRHMVLYIGKCLGQMEFENILFYMVKFTRQILSNMSQ